ncbi:homocysteine S-methyltransferase family protein [Jannaschia donghaensis]|uniref:Bifunctional homocysteine S-methyltransferase/5,10-methylenetetrahydrofolate reductase n=1 Tax=Jannaschia donghaensis TaxID=420998 RepID=A0A0M6YGU7_9RHOB|nr:homocysteine S-methyltransferase family protein [Jannaschia donghaensis]CTQ49154.1 Bifunctional homocysteine S-methyltransferase/5,10-methylenetetrahydrofolate reductase [Jannaschia donghaensis]
MTDIALLDGGNGQEIIARSGKPSHPLWSLQVMFDTPDVIADVHRAFIDAGSRVITLNTYAVTPARMARDGDAAQFDAAQASAIRIAQDAIRRAGSTGTGVQIAGCLPPLVASFHADAAMGYDASLADYRRIVAAQAGHVDVFLIETMSNITEARAALDAARETDVPVYLGLSIADDMSDRLRSGEDLTEAVAILADKAPDGIFLNCSTPEAITRAMPILARSGTRFGAYANGFVAVEALTPGGTVASLTTRNLTPQVYADFAAQWVDLGATIIGGCCEVGPAHIAHLADRLRSAGHRITALD